MAHRTGVRAPSRLAAAFFDRDAALVAPDLLGALISTGTGEQRATARIVEVEAYRGADDPGSHAFRGRTPRNAAMFGPPGTLYVYFVYGMHFCANVVCGPAGTPHAVLLRAAEPRSGVDVMRTRRRSARRDHDLLRGPGNLAAALGIDRDLDGARPGRRWSIGDDGSPAPEVRVTTRIGLAAGRGDDLELRFVVVGSPAVSRSRAG